VIVACAFCDQPVNTELPGALIEVSGWSRIRTEGGTNALRERKSLGRAAHDVCLDIATRGGEQGALMLDERGRK
jgi:hypothetical protein